MHRDTQTDTHNRYEPGPALANRRRCSSCQLRNFPSLPFPPSLPHSSLSLPLPSLPFPSFSPLPSRRETDPVKPARGLGERCKLPQRTQSHFAALCARKTHLVAAFLVLETNSIPLKVINICVCAII